MPLEATMTFVVVERSFEEPIEFRLLQDQEDESAWCLEQYQVRFVRSYHSTDKRRMLCVYEAPDAEAVRCANRQAGLPFDRIWSADEYAR
jgi:hypothetical protein